MQTAYAVAHYCKIGKPLREFSELKRKIFTLCKSVKESVENR